MRSLWVVCQPLFLPPLLPCLPPPSLTYLCLTMYSYDQALQYISFLAESNLWWWWWSGEGQRHVREEEKMEEREKKVVSDQGPSCKLTTRHKSKHARECVRDVAVGKEWEGEQRERMGDKGERSGGSTGDDK